MIRSTVRPVGGKLPDAWLCGSCGAIGKFVSEIVLLIGYVLVAFDKDKQGWHDKIASTYVVRKQKGS